MKYFEKYCSETGIIYSDIKLSRSMKSKKLMKLWQECYKFSKNDRPITFWFKFKNTFFYGISNWEIYENTLPTIIAHFQALFYQTKRKELSSEIDKLKKDLTKTDAKGKWMSLQAGLWIICEQNCLNGMERSIVERYSQKMISGNVLMILRMNIPSS